MNTNVLSQLTRSYSRQRGFTLLEILLTIALLSFVASITIVAINPNRQLGQARDATRQLDTEKVLEAIQRYSVDSGRYPSNIRAIPNGIEVEICANGVDVATCDANGLISLESDLIPAYLETVPADPTQDDAAIDTGYILYKDDEGKVGVRAEQVEVRAEAIFAGVPTTFDPSWFGTYAFRRDLTIDSTEVSGTSDLSNFPVLVSMTLADLATVPNGGDVQNADGYDIVFTDDGGTQIDHEIELYDPVSGRIVMWVEVPLVRATVDTQIFMYYGESTVTTSPENVAGVWDASYVGVWHMAEDPTTDTDGDCAGFGFELCDSTINGNHANANGTFLPSDLVSGQIGNAIEFDGNDEYFSIPYSASMDVGGNQVTVEAYGYGAQSFPQDAPYIAKGSGTNNEQYMLGVNGGSNGTNDINFRITTSNQHYRYDEGTKPSNTWTNFVMRYDGGLSTNQLQLFAEGVSVFQAGAFGTLEQGNNEANIGKRLAGDNRMYEGRIDEIRVSSIGRSDDWIATTFNTLSKQGVGAGQFFSVMGPEASRP